MKTRPTATFLSTTPYNVGTAPTQSVGGFSYSFQVQGTTQATSGVNYGAWSNDTSPPNLVFSKSRGTTVGSNVSVAGADVLGRMLFLGADGTTFKTAAVIRAKCAQTPSGDMPGQIEFLTTPIGSSLPVLRLTIGNDGSFLFAGAFVTQTRTVTAAGAVTVTTADYTVYINKTVGAATTVNLPASPATGLEFRFKDLKGDANVNNITLTPASGTIDGAATYVMNVARQATKIQYNGTEWSVL
jgi:hypothetical protein